MAVWILASTFLRESFFCLTFNLENQKTPQQMRLTLLCFLKFSLIQRQEFPDHSLQALLAAPMPPMGSKAMHHRIYGTLF